MQGTKKSSESKTVKSLQIQVETLEKYITKLTRTVNKDEEMKMQLPSCSGKLPDPADELKTLREQLSQLEEEKRIFLAELEKLTAYLNNLVEHNAELQKCYQEKTLELQKYKLMSDEIGHLEQELKGKTDEVKLLRE